MRDSRRCEPRVRAMGPVTAQSRREGRQLPYVKLLRVVLEAAATLSIALLVTAATTRLPSAVAGRARQDATISRDVAVENPVEACGKASQDDLMFRSWQAQDCVKAVLPITY